MYVSHHCQICLGWLSSHAASAESFNLKKLAGFESDVSAKNLKRDRHSAHSRSRIWQFYARKKILKN
ncbi:hypothetical protein ACSS6W_002626 [Trichoderma asperelloides]